MALIMRNSFGSILVFLALLHLSNTSRASETSVAKPQFKSVIYIVLENTNYKNALKQPFLSKLTKLGALFTQCRAEAHPSQPNYIAMIAGDTLGVRGDGEANLEGNQLGDLLNKKGLTWKAYAEDYPGNCFLGMTSGKYARKHVPFLSFKSVQNSASECAKVVNANEFAKDLSNQKLPNLSYYVPNLNHDGHDTNITVADQWLSQTFGDKIADPNFMKDTLIVITFDESELFFSSSNQIYTVFVGANVTPGATVTSPTSHYSILKTIEDNFALGDLGRNDAKTPSVLGIWR